MRFALVAALFLTACPKAGTDKAETATAAPSPAFWMSVKDGKLHRGLDEAPLGLYSAGDVDPTTPNRFVPSGDIEGSGPVGDSAGASKKGWLDLATGQFIDGSAPKPPPPYLEGTMTPSGFSPSSRKVHY